MYRLSKYIGLEKSHNMMIGMLNKAQYSGTVIGILEEHYKYTSKRLQIDVFDQKFRNPVGVAAGFDKNAQAVRALEAIGFGYIEVGTVTPRSQLGNEKPRMFKLAEDEGIINRLGFNNHGMRTIYQRLSGYDTEVPVGVNIGKMNDSNYKQSLDDYRNLVSVFGEMPSYYVLNVSCPNTPDKYDEQEDSKVSEIVGVVTEVINDTPVLVKISPDESDERLKSMSNVINNSDIAGVIATNTTKRRPNSLESPHEVEEGGLSGRPLRSASNQVIELMYGLTDVPIIGVGGVSDGRTAYDKITSGASLVQLYTGIVHNGLSSAYEINRELDSILRSNGFKSVSEAVGSDVKE